MNKLEIAKNIIQESIHQLELYYGIYNSRNLVGDPMIELYSENGLKVDVCTGYGYYEVFGLSSSEFNKLEKYYDDICRMRYGGNE